MEVPSDAEVVDDAAEVEDAVVVRPSADIKLDLLRLAAGTAKGEAASEAEKGVARNYVASLEDANPTEAPCLSGCGTITGKFRRLWVSFAHSANIFE